MEKVEEIANLTFPGAAQMKGGARWRRMGSALCGACRSSCLLVRRDSLNLSGLPEQKLPSDCSSVIHVDNVVLRWENKLNDSKRGGASRWRDKSEKKLRRLKTKHSHNLREGAQRQVGRLQELLAAAFVCDTDRHAAIRWQPGRLDGATST